MVSNVKDYLSQLQAAYNYAPGPNSSVWATINRVEAYNAESQAAIQGGLGLTGYSAAGPSLAADILRAGGSGQLARLASNFSGSAADRLGSGGGGGLMPTADNAIAAYLKGTQLAVPDFTGMTAGGGAASATMPSASAPSSMGTNTIKVGSSGDDDMDMDEDEIDGEGKKKSTMEYLEGKGFGGSKDDFDTAFAKAGYGDIFDKRYEGDTVVLRVKNGGAFEGNNQGWWGDFKGEFNGVIDSLPAGTKVKIVGGDGTQTFEVGEADAADELKEAEGIQLTADPPPPKPKKKKKKLQTSGEAADGAGGGGGTTAAKTPFDEAVAGAEAAGATASGNEDIPTNYDNEDDESD